MKSTHLLVVASVFCSISALAADNRCSSIKNSSPSFDKDTKQFNGCRLQSVDTDSMYEKLGLKVGDLVQPEGMQSSKALILKKSEKTAEGFKTDYQN